MHTFSLHLSYVDTGIMSDDCCTNVDEMGIETNCCRDGWGWSRTYAGTDVNGCNFSTHRSLGYYNVPVHRVVYNTCKMYSEDKK